MAKREKTGEPVPDAKADEAAAEYRRALNVLTGRVAQAIASMGAANCCLQHAQLAANTLGVVAGRLAVVLAEDKISTVAEVRRVVLASFDGAANPDIADGAMLATGLQPMVQGTEDLAVAKSAGRA